MSVYDRLLAGLAGTTRKIVKLDVLLHCYQLGCIKKAAQAKVSKAYKVADNARAAEYAARESWRVATADRRIKAQEAVTLAREVSPTITAVDGEIARYNG